MELGKAIELFLGEHKPTTRKSYTYPLRQMRDWIGPARQVSDIRPEHLIEYFQTQVKNGKYAPATEVKNEKTLKGFFNWCVRLEIIEKSPAKLLRASKVPRRISRDKAMPDDDLTKLLDHLRHKTVPRDFALVLFLADTGCRRGGAAGLRIQDVDFDGLIATVTEKGGEPRPVAFSEQCAKAILHWLAYRSAHYTIKGVFVFSKDGGPMDPVLISQEIRRSCRRVGIKVRSSHSLRHRKGHQFADARIAPSIAATALGHSSSHITVESYYPSDWDTAEKALRELMTVNPTNPKIVNISR